MYDEINLFLPELLLVVVLMGKDPKTRVGNLRVFIKLASNCLERKSSHRATPAAFCGELKTGKNSVVVDSCRGR